MNQDSLSFTLTQISYLVSTLNKKNFDKNSRQLDKLVREFGLEADRHYLRCLFAAIDFADSQIAKHSLQAKLLCGNLLFLLGRPSFVSTICYTFENYLTSQKTLKLSPNFLNTVARTLSLSQIKEVAIAYSLLHSANPELAKYAEQHLKTCLPKFIQSYIDIDPSRPNQEGSLNDIAPELLQVIISVISHGKHAQFGLSDVIYDKFITHLCRDFPRDRVPLILAPLLYAEEPEVPADRIVGGNQAAVGVMSSGIMDTSWANLVMDIGYSFTVSVDECKNHLIKVTGREIGAQDVAKILALMCRTHSNLSESSINLPTPGAFWAAGAQGGAGATGTPADGTKDKVTAGPPGTPAADHVTWKPDVFVQALKEVVPALSWKDVCVGLDHAEFMLKDRAGLNLLVTTLRLGLQSMTPPQNFPAECLYRHWTNTEGQLSLISLILKNADIFSFADYIFTSVSVELLKTPPEADNKEIAAWKSLHLVEVLLYIAENGFYTAVMELFKTPIQHCPDVLFMALLQINPPLTVLRQELFQNLIPIFLGNHPNSGAILHHAWNSANLSPSLRHIIMHSMSEWYLRGDNDQSRLSRILDVAQDLKALSNLLNVRSFMFVIDLACLASRREYLKLEKWLSDKIREHGEPFVQVMVKFLQRRCPQIVGAKILDDQLPKAAQLPHETLNTMVSCLHACIGNVQPELNEIIITMNANCNNLMKMQQRQPPPPNVLRPHRAIETPFNASSLGGQIFTAPTVDSFTSNMAGLNLGGPGNGSFNFNVLGNLMSTPASPSRLLSAPSNSPFSIMPMQSTPQMNITRIQPTPTGDKITMAPNTQQLFTDGTSTVSKEAEDEANSYFQRIYNHPPHPTLSVDEVLDILQRFQESRIRFENEVYTCMLRNLFEEYRFFPQYPDKELQITAQLFGGMIERSLVATYVSLGLALRCVFDALRKPEGSKMYYFGITALDRFKSKLHLYQKYCEHVRTIPHFDQFPPHLVEYVEYGANQQEPPNKPQAIVQSTLAQMAAMPSSTGGTSALYSRSSSVTSNLTTTPTAKTPNPTNPPSASLTTSRVKSIANATNIDTLLVATQDREEKIVTPPDAVQEKTAFIFNNLSQLNLTQKCEEIKEIMTKDYWAWLSQYLVLKRASIEVNFHVLYSNFLDALKINEINRLVTKETFRNIRVLLRSDKSIANFSDRSLLKNLGHWLGMLTLGRNRPILHVDIDLKSLLMEAYHKGQQELLYVVPFVAKVLESCAKSKVFQPPNPWTMAIMNVLAELHQEPELKLNLKFEIEVLCKNFNIDVSDLKPVVYLKDAEKAHKIEYQLSQPGKVKEPIQQPIAPLHSGATASDDTSSVTSSTPAPSSSSGNVAGSPSQSLDAQSTALGPPEPRFNYMDITVSNFSCINNLMTISPNILLLHTQPHLKALVRTAIERTLTDWMTPVVERSVKIATTTCEQIIRKDFALDGDENRMRTAAHYMIRNLSAGMAMITCREQLLLTITTNIKNAFNAAVTPQQKEFVDAAATQLASDNMELACAIIQKTTVEKAIPEIDKRLASDYEIRKVTRQEGRRYCDEAVYNYHCENMPKRIRLKIGGISSEQFAVYDEFARNIPGFQPITDQDMAHFLPAQSFQDPMSMSSFAAQMPQQTVVGSNQFSGSDFGTLYDDLGNKIESFLNGTMNMPGLQVQTTNMASLLDYLVAARRQRDNMTAISLLNKAVEGLLDGFVNIPEHAEHIKMFRDIHLRVMRMMQDSRAFGVVTTNRIITKYFFECREEIRYNLEAIDLLFSSNFINVPNFDILLSQLMDNGNNYLAVAFAMQLIQHFCIEERQATVLTENDFVNTIDLLTRISVHHHRAPEGLPHLIEILRLNQDPNNLLSIERMQNPHINSGIVQVRNTNEMEDPPGLISKTEYLLKDWVNIYHNQALNRDPMKVFGMFVGKMNICGILKTDDLITRFFRQATQLCIDVVYTNINEVNNMPTVGKSKCFQWIDAFVRLIALLVKHSGDNGNATTKINLLNKVLGIVVGVLQQDQEVRGVAFQQLGYHRLFIMLFLELSNPEPVLENISLHTVTAFCHTYHLIRPSVAPGFCYSWLELISHRVFIGRVLAMIPQQKGWSMYSQLLMDLFKYLAPFLRNAELAKPVTLLYKGTLRVLLVLLHDFPEFLCDHHFGFCDAIPPNCIQMRNIILSAFPRNMRLPDPFTPNLKVDMLSEISTAPRIFTNYVSNIQPATFKKDLDSYLKARAPVTFLSELRGHLQVSNEPGSRYNIPLMNALVLYVGNQAITLIRSKNLVPNMTTIVHSAHMDIFQNLAVDLDNEGRYLFLNAVANQLRYPNSHTHYFSCVLLYLFVEANSEAIQEQITRVLLERLIVNRPHPWGLLITFIELIKNPVYKFWDHDFVHCAPEIEKLFESVARSCMVVKTNNQQTLNSVEAELQECN
ncbi:CCR4-NOT transcription complex subunit 1 isoform X2 [Lutzomyia longipalpis]|uniref:CCR4-NOT transcription complex subunit 1 isoform X2 n=1 Tax=Lutzomyia longipalpis TaxID=7200 RepID=UPI002483AB10|nr:CCR4-NOT transcription complex subunit 1 isoform X2 [Lutzomyia longipalpis]